MSKKIIQYIVIILGALIVLAFLAVIYGMYLKISSSSYNQEKSSYLFSSNLLKDEKIKNIEVINKDHILILIDKGDHVKGAIYSLKKNEIIRFIDQ